LFLLLVITISAGVLGCRSSYMSEKNVIFSPGVVPQPLHGMSYDPQTDLVYVITDEGNIYVRPLHALAGQRRPKPTYLGNFWADSVVTNSR
jgi:hypothetical protein